MSPRCITFTASQLCSRVRRVQAVPVTFEQAPGSH